MSVEAIIGTITRLISVHQDLNQLAKKKTEIIKDGEIEKLEILLKEEGALVLRLKELETTRSGHVRDFLSHKGILAEDRTLAQLAMLVSPGEKEELLGLRQRLTDEIAVLKQQNKLNQELIEQSLQFVNVSLGLLQPEVEPVNYERPGRTDPVVKKGKSMFDSRA